ncbi:transcriptional regulator with XRE-family HTH domain [Nocardiopsis mwathae]|uniref:Transcriptional regulator with XRE-family HTH domain n=1 Tax=Nocardiopsis mwathae TaxID=1472723 RepID=A0A7W9YH56_9ACTN|nr:helix-turn-helix transcriptional regulator [Nocardiopsis mwathae]MBB6172057.1 transcriptional regulator with XRE-family HTH domain [Nocardiopsis mwathae]
MPQRDGVLAPEFWSRSALATALATCDMAVIVEEVRLARGWSQGELARVVGYSQSWVSRVVNGQQSLTVDQVREIAERLDVPIHLLRFTRKAASGRGADPTRRRDFGRVVAATAVTLPAMAAGPTAPAAPWPDIDLGENTAAALRAITGAQRRLDAAAPARDLAGAAGSHLDLITRTLERAEHTPFAPQIAAAASEAAGFTAWLHTDMGDAGTARRHYRAAIVHARHSDDRLLTAYMIGSLAAFEIDTGDPELGLALTREAGRQLGPDAHPTACAWLACVRALGRSALGAASAASRDIAAAEAGVDRVDNSDPPWPWVFAFDHAKVAGYRALAGVRLRRPHEARAAFGEAFGGARPTGKQGAVLQVELASAHADAGDVDEAFRLAAEALGTGVRMHSERVIGRVRRFRRAYRGPCARSVREFDAQLTGLLSA